MSLDTITGPDQPPIAVRGAMKDALTLTPAAAQRIQHLLAQKNPQAEALIVSITSKGCSGHSYDIQYLERLADRPKFADVVTQHGVTVVVDPKASLYILGSVMDYREDKIKSGFDFQNPNAVSLCGCGESFSVDPNVIALQKQGNPADTAR